MKKILFYIILSIMVLGLSGCGTKKEEIDPLSQDTIYKIETIGEVTLEDQELIENLMKTYSEMTDNQKDQVKNYLTLKNAKEELDKLLEQKAADDEAAKKEENEKKFERQRSYYQFVQEGIAYAKSNMKHPTSFVVKGVIVYEEDKKKLTPFALISYEAENDLGNSISGVVCYSNIAGQYIADGDIYETSYSENEQIINGNGDATHKKVEDNSFIGTSTQGNDIYYFQLDIDDYKSQGFTGVE